MTTTFTSFIIGGTDANQPDVNLTPTGALLTGATSGQTPDTVGAEGFNTPTTIALRPPIAIAGNGEPASQTFQRIWIVPNSITLNNPQIGVPVPFVIWNAFTTSNTLNTITGGVTGITINPNVGTTFDALQQIDFTITVTAAAPPTADTVYNFDLTLGDGSLTFSAIVVEFVETPPEQPIDERWTWLTDVIRSYNATEDRIALRAVPRFSLSFNVFIDEREDYALRFQELAFNTSRRALIPYFQYAAPITTPSLVGVNRIFFNPALSSARDGQFLLLLDEVQGINSLVQINQIEIDGATLNDTLTTATFRDTTLAIPMISSLIEENPTIGISRVSGQSTVATRDLEPTVDFVRSDASPTINQFNSIDVLDRQPIESGEDRFQSGKEIIEGDDTALRQLDDAFPRVFIQKTHRFAIRRYIEPNEMDYWREFLSRAQGQRNVFYHATYLSDLTLAQPVTAATSTIFINENEYASRFFPFNTYKQLRFETRDGAEFYANVQTATNQQLGLDITFQANQTDIVKISYLNLVRLENDEVILSHDSYTTVLTLQMRAIDV